jgi:ATP/maltotriose-dependent transcriptional regulator MalT
MTTDELAATLMLSVETVRSHLKRVYRKLGVRSREEAVRASVRLRTLAGMYDEGFPASGLRRRSAASP